MINIIGAIMLIGAAAAWGVGSVLRLKGRVQNLSSILTALEVMRGEICERLTPMPELLEMLRDESPYPAGLFFEKVRNSMSDLGTYSFAAIWRRSVETTPELLLTEQETQTLAELGFSLGRYDAKEQSNALSYTIRRMEIFLQKAEAQRDKDSKTQAFLGVAAGVFAVIILL